MIRIENLPPIDKASFIDVIKHYGAPAYVDMDKKIIRFNSKLEADAFIKRQKTNLGCKLTTMSDQETLQYYNHAMQQR